MLYSQQYLLNQHKKRVTSKKEEGQTKKSDSDLLRQKIDFEKFRELFLRLAKNDPCFGCIN